MIDDAGPTVVRKCNSYLDDVYYGDEDKLWQFEELFERLEEDFECSGICTGIEDDPLSLYVFSNVNNGSPKVTCKEPLSELIDSHIGFFLGVFMVVAAMTGIMLSLLVLLLVCQIWLYCRRKCCKKKADKKDKKKRANNGMVLGSEDYDDPDE